MVVAALMADGTSTIENIYHIDRGYEKLEEKILLLGGKIKRIKDGENIEQGVINESCV